jgi:hypothetical protein
LKQSHDKLSQVHEEIHDDAQCSATLEDEMNVTKNARGVMSALILTAAACVGFVLPATAQADEDGWRHCADEGQTCGVAGRAMVRYGTEGRWTNRTVFNSVSCNNDAFGDPAPDVPKRCQVRVSGAGAGGPGSSAGWRFCAAEGEICQFKGMAEVRFGQGDRFVTRSAYGGARCDVQDFGDPVYGVTKFCEMRQAGGQGNSSQGSWGGGGSASGGWRYCAAEGQTCRVQGSAQVRFGDGRRFSTRRVNGEVQCSVETFGDPAYGTLKHCEVQASNYNDGGSPRWTYCAAEGERCDFSGQVQVRYGTVGRYIYRDANHGVLCNSNAFGGDPYVNRVKTCEIRR